MSDNLPHHRLMWTTAIGTVLGLVVGFLCYKPETVEVVYALVAGAACFSAKSVQILLEEGHQRRTWIAQQEFHHDLPLPRHLMDEEAS